MRRKINKKPILKHTKVFTIWETLQVFTDDHAFEGADLLFLGDTHANPGTSPRGVRPSRRSFVRNLPLTWAIAMTPVTQEWLDEVFTKRNQP